MNYWLPLSLRMGVPYSEFWRLNPRRIKPFIKAYQDTLEENQRIENINAWRQGQYIKVAIAAALDRKVKYPEQPFGEESKEKTPKEIDKIVSQRAQLFAAQMEIFNQKFIKAEQASSKSGENT